MASINDTNIYDSGDFYCDKCFNGNPWFKTQNDLDEHRRIEHAPDDYRSPSRQ